MYFGYGLVYDVNLQIIIKIPALKERKNNFISSYTFPIVQVRILDYSSC
jgi:hypothetical protein